MIYYSQRNRRPISRWFLVFIMSSLFMVRITRAFYLGSRRTLSTAAFVEFPSPTTFREIPQRRQLSGSLYSSQQDLDDEILTETGYSRPVVQWYPGHIAKAERQLSETLKAVDVVVEVRDARACKATAHPRVGEWCAGSPRIVVLTHLDMIPKIAASSWRRAYEKLGAERWDDAPLNAQVANQAQQARDVRFQYKDEKTKKTKKTSINSNKNTAGVVTPVEEVLFVNAKQGQGIHALHRAIFKAGAHVQERRERRGLKTRALRVGIIGYPNVGKVSRSCLAFAKNKTNPCLFRFLIHYIVS